MTIKDWQQRVYRLAYEKGFWDNPYLSGSIAPETVIDQKLMLIVGELSEAHEEIRKGYPPAYAYYEHNGVQIPLTQSLPTDKPEGFGIELADAVIRIMDLCEALGIDLEGAMLAKHAYNLTRPYKHGKRF
jgi:NTP pyrophosphatase (non-canonical NTP hydrolase)